MSAIMSSQKMATEKFEISWLGENLLYIRVYSNKVMMLDDIKKLYAFQLEMDLTANHKRLIHAEKYASISTKAREYAQDNALQVKAEAYVLTSLPQRIL